MSGRAKKADTSVAELSDLVDVSVRVAEAISLSCNSVLAKFVTDVSLQIDTVPLSLPS